MVRQTRLKDTWSSEVCESLVKTANIPLAFSLQTTSISTQYIDLMQISRDVTAKPEAMIKASRVAGIIKQIPVHPQTWFATLQTRMTKCQQHYSTLRDIKENHWLPEAADAKAAGVKVSGFTCLTKLFELSLKLPSERFEPPLAAWLWLHLSCSSAIIIAVYVCDMIWRQWPDM